MLTAGRRLPLVAGDPDKVGQVLINLVDNAVKYSPDGGRVEVDRARAARSVRFSVADEGLGIPPAEQRRIFEKFYRLDPNMTRGVGGTGLGLYICRELVRRMDGRIWVESEGLGRGSVFHVELPVGRGLVLSETAARGPPFASVRRRPCLDAGRRRVLDVGGRAAAPAPPTPPQLDQNIERQDEADRPDDHQDHADRVDVDAGDGRVDRPGQDRAGCDQDQADSDAHCSDLLVRASDVGLIVWGTD